LYETSEPEDAAALDIFLNRDSYAKYIIYPGFNYGIEELINGTFKTIGFYVKPYDWKEALEMVENYRSAQDNLQQPE